MKRSYEWLQEYIKPEWKTKKRIIKDIQTNEHFKMDERRLRQMITKFNEEYDAKKMPEYIVHGNHGYKLVRNKDAIYESLADNQKRALTMLKQNNKVRKSLRMKPLQQLEIGD